MSCTQESCLCLNHAIVNPLIDRSKPVDQIKDVFISVEKETNDGIYISGAKVEANNSALTHYNFVEQGSAQLLGDNTDFVLMFLAPLNAKGMKLICRPSYELVAGMTGSPFDYPLSSHFDENGAIPILDNVFIPWEMYSFTVILNGVNVNLERVALVVYFQSRLLHA